MTKKLIIDVNISLRSKNEVVARLLELVDEREDVVIVTGGTKLEREYAKNLVLLRRINSFSRRGRANKVDKRPNERVDSIAERIEAATVEKVGRIPDECDDFHILALCLDCNADIIITGDVRMATCIKKIRARIGHDLCPSPKFVRNIDDLRSVFPSA